VKNSDIVTVIQNSLTIENIYGCNCWDDGDDGKQREIMQWEDLGWDGRVGRDE
jgi:hypothetical protein